MVTVGLYFTGLQKIKRKILLVSLSVLIGPNSTLRTYLEELLFIGPLRGLTIHFDNLSKGNGQSFGNDLAIKEGRYRFTNQCGRMFFNLTAKGGETALHWASLDGRENAAAILLKYGANPALRNTAGQSALDISATNSISTLLRGSTWIFC
jgi:hypothetical protein